MVFKEICYEYVNLSQLAQEESVVAASSESGKEYSGSINDGLHERI
jgi:hypothetical protein